MASQHILLLLYLPCLLLSAQYFLTVVGGTAARRQLHRCYSCFTSCKLTSKGELEPGCDCGGDASSVEGRHSQEFNRAAIITPARRPNHWRGGGNGSSSPLGIRPIAGHPSHGHILGESAMSATNTTAVEWGSIAVDDDLDGGICYGESCFVKVEIFPDEMVGAIQKGCVHSLPAGLDGCHHAGQLESTHCYCRGELCNRRADLADYTAKPLPTVECCECSQPSGDNCPGVECLRTCEGNYCLVDFDGVEQGCGLGIPRLQSFLRTPNYLKEEHFRNTRTTCARYQAAQNTNVHGCVCSAPMMQMAIEGEAVGDGGAKQEVKTGCNQLNESRRYQVEEVVTRRQNDQNYCYSLHQRANKPFTRAVYNGSDTCEGHYCFVSMTTYEVVVERREWEEEIFPTSPFSPSSPTTGNGSHRHVAVAHPRYELLAGCLKVDVDEKVSVGCTTEYGSNAKGARPTSRHCICESHLCNFFPLLHFNSTVEQLAKGSAADGDGGADNGSNSTASSGVYRDDGEVNSGVVNSNNFRQMVTLLAMAVSVFILAPSTLLLLL